MSRYRKHVFVCENTRPPDHPKGSCAAKGSHDVRMLMRDAIRRRGIQTDVRINSCGCLDACEFGVSVVVYPDGVWYGGVTSADVQEIVDEHLVADRPVERLRITEEMFQQKQKPV